MNSNEVSATSLSFIGDAIYSLKVREYYVSCGYMQGKKLQELSKRYVSARGQTKVFNRLLEAHFFNDDDLTIFKRGRNAISHIPKNGDLVSYQIASGVEALCGYYYLFDQERMNLFFDEMFKGGEENE